MFLLFVLAALFNRINVVDSSCGNESPRQRSIEVNSVSSSCVLDKCGVGGGYDSLDNIGNEGEILAQAGFCSCKNDRPRYTSELAQLGQTTVLFRNSANPKDVAVLEVFLHLLALSDRRIYHDHWQLCLLGFGYFHNFGVNLFRLELPIDIQSKHSFRDSSHSLEDSTV